MKYKLKALKSFSHAYVGNITSGQVFECDNDDHIAFWMEHKLIEPVGDFAYQNKMIQQEDIKKKSSESTGSDAGKAKPLSVSPADPASPPDKSNISENGENPTPAGSSSQTAPTEPSDSQTSSMDATEAGGDTRPKAATSRRGRTSAKRPAPRAGRRTARRPKD